MNTNFADKTKDECRKYAKALRSKLDMEKISEEICNNLKAQDFYRYSQHIMGFYPFNNEVDLRELYKDSAKNWYLPRVDMCTRSLVIHQYREGDILEKNKWGIYEPYEGLEAVDLSVIDVVIIPALMVDKKGMRLGYGAGFYDRFIPGLRKNCVKIVPLPEELFVEILPCDHWDVPVDKIVTNNHQSP